MKFARYIFALLFLSLLACKDIGIPAPVDDLPPETQTGTNTFGCIVNGKVWVPKRAFPIE